MVISIIGEERFLAVVLEKSRAAKDWEDADYFNQIVLTKGIDNKYYLSKIEHITDILVPKYVERDRSIQWVEENTESQDKILIDNLYSLNNSRCEYTLTINDKPYSFYEKYIVYLISVSYEIYETYNKVQKIAPYFKVRCKFDSHHWASALEDTPSQILEYPISIESLLQTSISQIRPFEIWQGKIIVEDLIITLKS